MNTKLILRDGRPDPADTLGMSLIKAARTNDTGCVREIAARFDHTLTEGRPATELLDELCSRLLHTWEEPATVEEEEEEILFDDE